jgi:xylulose-5-phosphate/fructose-6-phosphate phosphoketolase
MTDVFERYRLSLPQTRTTLDRVDAWWRAANHVASALPGGTRPGVAAVTLTYAHLNRMIVRRRQRIRFVLGVRDGMAALEAVARMEDTRAGARPTGGFAAHGGGRSYALAYAVGMALDEPGLTVAALVDEDEAVTAWQARSLHDPRTDGAVLPILYQPSRDRDGVRELFRARGWEPIEIGSGVCPHDVDELHRCFAAALYVALDQIAALTAAADSPHPQREARWPMLVLRTPVDWPPADVVPVDWFDEDGRLIPEIAQAAPTGDMRMSADW